MMSLTPVEELFVGLPELDQILGAQGGGAEPRVLGVSSTIRSSSDLKVLNPGSFAADDRSPSTSIRIEIERKRLQPSLASRVGGGDEC